MNNKNMMPGVDVTGCHTGSLLCQQFFEPLRLAAKCDCGARGTEAGPGWLVETSWLRQENRGLNGGVDEEGHVASFRTGTTAPPGSYGRLAWGAGEGSLIVIASPLLSIYTEA